MSSIREFKNVHRHRHMHTHTREKERQREREKEDILTDARNKKGTRHTLAITSLHPVSWAFMTDSQQRHSAGVDNGVGLVVGSGAAGRDRGRYTKGVDTALCGMFPFSLSGTGNK